MLVAQTGFCFKHVPNNSGLLLPRNIISPQDVTIPIHRNKKKKKNEMGCINAVPTEPGELVLLIHVSGKPC